MQRIGIDIGGTFTDFVVQDITNGRISTLKLLSNPTNPAKTVLDGLKRINFQGSGQIIHGSTVATNALLEHRGARTALITTYGFKDVLEIGRQSRPELYDWTVKPAPPLVPSDLRIEVHERLDRNGNVMVVLDPQEVEEICEYLIEQKAESVAICLLFSFLRPDHEIMVAEILRKRGHLVSASCEILPEFREYDRMSTTVINAYVSPILDKYISRLMESLSGKSLQIMQSNGGMISLNEARKNGARCILSGPAGGIIGAFNAGKLALEVMPGSTDTNVKLITFDMGGTSTDVSLIEGKPGYTTDTVIGGYPIHLPLLDIHTIGAGGGSIASVDAGGSLRVGPQSAGAEPGPACYGAGELPTVTDANLVLGRLIPDYFLGGEMKIYPDRAFAALDKLSKAFNLTAVQTAQGVIEVVNAQMDRALRVISIERGHDPHDFTLLSFGGAGGLHAVKLARQLNIPTVIIPKLASTLSAYGMLASDVIKDYVKTVMLPGSTDKEMIDNHFFPMVAQGKTELVKEGIPVEEIDIQCSLDVRYFGQSYEISVVYNPGFLSDFHKTHDLTYGYSYPEKEIEIVNLRVRAIGNVTPISIPRMKTRQKYGIAKPIRNIEIEFDHGREVAQLYRYDLLQPGQMINGPALIVSSDTTILIEKLDVVQVDGFQNLIITIGYK